MITDVMKSQNTKFFIIHRTFSEIGCTKPIGRDSKDSFVLGSLITVLSLFPDVWNAVSGV